MLITFNDNVDNFSRDRHTRTSWRGLGFVLYPGHAIVNNVTVEPSRVTYVPSRLLEYIYFVANSY